MSTQILTGIIMLAVLALLFFILFAVNRSKLLNTRDELKKSKKDFEILKEKIDYIKQDLSPKRVGFYTETTNLLSREDKEDGKTGDKYDAVVHVRELEKYTNGVSKLQLITIDVTSGYDHDQYDWVKTCMRDSFTSLKKTTDVEWLEPEESVKEARKLKLDKLEKLMEQK